MRLLNVHTWEMKTFASKKYRPPYAILSHTWTDHEVSLQVWESSMAKGLEVSLIAHSSKVRQFGEMVKTHSGEWGDGFTWIWVDTCCIDQKSSAELSEAINSMYAWYQEAARCYAYLEDVALLPSPRLACDGIARSSEETSQDSSDINPFAKEFTTSRWFTRGWTLQELVAPLELIFISQDWSVIGGKNQQPLTDLVSSCTGIPDNLVAQGGWNPRSVTIADRMSWAANRETTRPEDVAYCLLGLMTVNMPLLYGEGEVRAFHRLQEEIIKTDYDQTMLAWGDLVEENFSTPMQRPLPGHIKPPKWRAPSERPRFDTCGLFANSPRDFNTSLSIDVESDGYHHVLARQRPPSVVNGGILLDLVVLHKFTTLRYEDESRFAWFEKYDVVMLMCVATDRRTSKKHGLAITLHAGNDGYHTRTRELCIMGFYGGGKSFGSETCLRHVRPVLRNPFACREDWFIRVQTSWLVRMGFWSSTTNWGQDCHLRWQNNIIHFAEHDSEHMTFGFIYELPRPPQVGVDNAIVVCFRRTIQRENENEVVLHAAITPPMSLYQKERSPHESISHYSPWDFEIPEATQWHLMPREWELCKLGPVAGLGLAIGTHWHDTRYVLDFHLASTAEVFGSPERMIEDIGSS